jgi:23S rRNA pseudouridine1911/1915/1917 synthase
MQPSKRSPKTVSAEHQPEWLECALSIVNGELENDVEIELETGRTHQIRVQLAALGSPILGDTVYGSTDVYRPLAIALFSTSISWSYPEGREWSFALPPPWLPTK